MFSFAKNQLRKIRRKWRLLRCPSDFGSRQADQLGKLSDEPSTAAIFVTSVPMENKLALQDGALDTHSGLTYEDAPIAVLPFDLLRIIFDIYAHDNRPYEEYPRSVRRCWPKLSHVCATWRFVLLNMPLLWGRDVCVFGVKDEPGTPFRIMLARARGAPLDLVLSCEQWMQLSPEEQLGVPADLHLPLFTRARQLILRAETPTEISALLDAVSGRPLPRLEVLDLDVYCTNTAAQWTATLQNAVNLRHLVLRGIYMRPPVSGGLVNLEISTPSGYETYRPLSDELLDVLSHNPGLSRLFLKDAFSGSPARRLSRVVLPSLLKCYLIQFRSGEERHLRPFLDCLSMPNVDGCNIEGIHEDDSMGASQKLMLLQASLAACAGSPALFLNALNIMHKPEELEIWVHMCWDDMDLVGFRFTSYSRGQTQPAATADAAIGHLSDARIFERVSDLSLNVRGLQTDAVRHWMPVIRHYTRADDMWPDVKSTPDAMIVLGIMEDMRQAGVSLPRLRRLTVSNHDTEDALDDGSGDFQAMRALAQRLGVYLRIYDKFKPGDRDDRDPEDEDEDEDEVEDEDK